MLRTSSAFIYPSIARGTAVVAESHWRTAGQRQKIIRGGTAALDHMLKGSGYCVIPRRKA